MKMKVLATVMLCGLLAAPVYGNDLSRVISIIKNTPSWRLEAWRETKYLMPLKEADVSLINVLATISDEQFEALATISDAQLDAINKLDSDEFNAFKEILNKSSDGALLELFEHYN